MSNMKEQLRKKQLGFLSEVLKGRGLKTDELLAPQNINDTMNRVASQAIRSAVGTRKRPVYSENVKECDRKPFRETWQEFLHATAMFYRYPVSGKEHIEKIKSMCDLLTKNHGGILENGKMRFGVTQMGLNVYLKYLWCLGEIPPPLHCPVSENGWTGWETDTEYKIFVDGYREQAKNHGLTQKIQEVDAVSIWGLFTWKGK